MIIIDKYIDLLRQYYFIGGMPEAVAAFSQNQDFSRVREIQNRILAAYEQDFSKHVPVNTVTRLRVLWNSIPSQLARENRKFTLSRQIQYIKGSRYFASTVFHVPKSLFNSHLSEDYKIFRMIRKLRLIPFLQEYWPIPGVPARVPEDYFDCDLDAVIRPLRFDCRRIEGYFAGLCW